VTGWLIRLTLAATGAALLSGCAAVPDTGSAAHLIALDARLGDHVLTVATLDPRTFVVLSDDHAYAMTLNSTLREIDLTEEDGRPAQPRARIFRIELDASRNLIYSCEWSTPAQLVGGVSALATSSGG